MAPDLSEYLKKPLNLNKHAGERSKDSWDKTAHKILTRCWNTKGAHYFQEPVDVVKFNLDDYFEIIK